MSLDGARPLGAYFGGEMVIGARRRSPVGKALMGSVTQTLILRAGVPVLVLKSDA